GEAIQHEYPEVLQCTRLFNFLGNGNLFVRVGDKVFEERKVLLADSNFFKVFTTPLLQGDPETALEKQNTVVITETTAKKYFGSVADAMNKSFTADNNAHFIVSGVCKDWPENSHFTFDMLIASSTFRGPANYVNFSAHTYLLLGPNASPTALEAKFPHIVEKYVSGEIGRNFGVSFQQFQSAGNGYHYFLQPLQKIHLTSDLEGELKPNGSLKAVYIFSVIAIFILVIACINFINLSTARSVERAKEVGIRKTFGSEKKSLIWQFLLESVMVSLLSLVLAVLLIIVLLPLFNKVSGKELTMVYFLEPMKIAELFAFAIGVGVIAGLYPAFVLSSFKPIMVLKGKFKSNKYGMVLRNGLVVFQFAISVILIICTIIVNQQMKYMLGDKLGFRKDHIIEIERADLLKDKSKSFNDEVAKIAGVEVVSNCSSFPGESGFFGSAFQEMNSKQPLTGRAVIVDDQFSKILDLQLKEGRFFSKEFATDSLALVLNEKAVAEMGLKKPIGAKITSPDFNGPNGEEIVYTVIGVAKDFHYQSLHQKIEPLVFVNTEKFRGAMATTGVRIKADDFKQAIASIENVWKNFVPEHPFHYNFLDKTLADQYKTEQTTQRVFTIFSVLAIFIACIGLLGLAAYATQLRVREISIRKVLGASVGGIVSMLSKDFLKLIIISAVVAFPIAWWGMHKWLESFAYRTSISWWVFLLAGVIAAFIALVTISFQAIKAAVANPVKTLRSE
ncbi:MAG: ABC transporter permease, partial [Bacteroidetes bacterium]|nr:ABC transporter permease [Bacteroidota bacterium]